ncbi:porin [Poriferisphaera sp. WC338]|uniref:porin n=1 Tax=Poriferisphaera sp. WC338 TaxID=3425129 RepID=UPI003D818F09
MTDRQVKAVKDLMREIFNDAATRDSLLSDPVMAGCKDGKFFIASSDNQFKLNFNAQFQFRYYYSQMDNRPSTIGESIIDEFQFRRARICFIGHAFDPKLKFRFDFGTHPYDGNTALELAYLKYEFNDQLTLLAGQWPLPFLRGELTSLTRQLAVARSSITEYFTLDASTGVQTYYKPSDQWKFSAAVSNGQYQKYPMDYADFGKNVFDLVITSRADLKLDGEWKQSGGYVAWRDEKPAAFIGVAINYMTGFQADVDIPDDLDYLAWTADVLYKNSGFMTSAAFTGSHTLYQDKKQLDSFGLELQSAYNITNKFQPFVRYEWFKQNTIDENDMQGVTVGANYFFKKHNLKLTCDAVYFFDGTVPTNNPFGCAPFSGALGLGAAAGDDFSKNQLLSFRTQLQFIF